MSFQDGQTSRTASGASREKPQDQSDKISQIEKSVTHLLVATKQLLEILTAWSRSEATEVNVSDVYVRLGYEFNIACRAFNGIGVETQDLGPVPDLLRNILEDTLSNEPSQASLEQYLPRIRDIIVNLLQGLKKKQQRLRQRNGREAISSLASESRRTSAGGMQVPSMQIDDRSNLSSSASQRSFSSDIPAQNNTVPMSRMSSAPTGTISPTRVDSIPPQRSKSSNRGTAEHPTSSTQVYKPPITVVPQETSSIQEGPFMIEKAFPQPPESLESASVSFDTPQSRPQPRQYDALAALQRGGELERRASRRFSAYQIQKHLGTNSGASMIPPSQHSPIPNRGRDRDAINAMRIRGSPLASNERANAGTVETGSPTRQTTLKQTPSFDKPFVQTDIGARSDPFDSGSLGSPMAKTPEDKLRNPFRTSNEEPQIGSSSGIPQFTATQPITEAQGTTNGQVYQGPREINPASEQVTSTNARELIVFLQYKTKVKRMVIEDGYEDLSIARLQLAFMDKFQWNTHHMGLELPEIYIQDPISGVRYELEDVTEVKNNAVLVLNVDGLDDVKRHVDDGIDNLKQIMEGVRSAIEDQKSVLQRLAETQQDAAKNIARFNAAPPQQLFVASSSVSGNQTSSIGNNDRYSEVQNVRRDLAVMRQTYVSLMSDMEASMAGLRAKADIIKVAAITASIPAFEGSSGRAYVDGGKKTLADDSEKIINRVDDLQDIVEDLRKDVVSRGVRPLPRQLETVNKEISSATAELKKLLEFIKREKPIWTRIWRTELEAVYDDQKNLNMQEELAGDLEKDLTEAANTFALVEEATKQQNLGHSQNTPTRATSRALLPTNTDIDPQKAKDGVLGEVRALQPNHETRLEAIERAEKARQKQLETRKEGTFQKELTGFVDEGRLKKSGGVQETERLRKAKDDRMRREVWERMNPGVSQPTFDADLLPKTAEASSAGTNDSETADVGPMAVSSTGGKSEQSGNPPKPTTAIIPPTPEPEFVVAAEQPIDIDP